MRSARYLAWIVACSVTIARAESPIDTGPPDGGPECSYDGGPDASPPAGDVPSNWPRFVSRALYPDEGSVVRLVRASDGSEVESERAYGVVLPLTDLVVGEDYDFYHPLCGEEPQHVTRYRATAPIARPPLGTIHVSRLYAANRVPGVEHRYYFVDVTLRPDPAIGDEPWVGVLWAPTVDGTSLTRQPAHLTAHQILVACDGRAGVPADTTSVGAVGGLGSRDVLEAAAVAVAWDCEDALRVEPASRRPLTPEEVAYWDTPSMDAGRAQDDAGLALDAGNVDGGRMGMDTEPDTDSSCAVAHGRRPAPLAMAMLLALAALARRGRSPAARIAAPTPTARLSRRR